MKKASINYDFLAVATLAFIASCGYNVYQQREYQALFSRHVDLRWNAQNAEADLVYIRNQLKACETSLETGSQAGLTAGRAAQESATPESTSPWLSSR